MSVVRSGRNEGSNSTPDEGWEPYMDAGEMLLWEGQPATGIRFRKSDFVMVPFSILWTGPVTIAAYNEISSGKRGFVLLFLVPFIIIGFYLMIGRFFWDAYKRRYTRYALTSRRAFIAANYWDRSLKSYPIGPSTHVDYRRVKHRPELEATIIFKTETKDDGEGGKITVEHGFEFIRDGEAVYELIGKIQAGDYERYRRET